MLYSKGKGGRPWRGRVEGRTGRRSRCCGFALVLGLSRAELHGMNIGFRELKMTAWSFRTSLTKWDPLTRPGSWDIEWNVSKIAVFRQKAVLRACFVRGVKCGPLQAGWNSEDLPAAGGLDLWDVLSDGSPLEAGLNSEYLPTAGGLDFWDVSIVGGLQQAGSNSEYLPAAGRLDFWDLLCDYSLILGVVNFQQYQAGLILTVGSLLTS